MILLETAFFPPVSYFAAIAEEFTLSPGRVNSYMPAHVFIEASENYQKQSYRSRCKIYAAGGEETLSVPVEPSGWRELTCKHPCESQTAFLSRIPSQDDGLHIIFPRGHVETAA